MIEMTIPNSVTSSVLLNIEDEICKISKYFPLDNREEVKQDVRIRLWKMMNAQYVEGTYSSAEDLYQYCLDHVYGVAMLCSKSVMSSRHKYNKRHIDIDVCNTHVADNSSVIDFSVDMEKYKKILNPKEFAIFNFLNETGDDIKNFDSISRKLGYSGKGSSKYNLTSIAKKILQYNKNLIASGL